jgi:hypothetical protein
MCSRNLVFFHFLRCGGSSVWAALWNQARTLGVPFLDIYHEARVKHGNNLACENVFRGNAHVLNHKVVIMHHHVPVCLEPFLGNNISFFTVVRDPVDRFLSELRHCVGLLRMHRIDPVHELGTINAETEIEGSGWPQKLIQMARLHHTTFEELITQALQYEHFRSYYKLWFARLLNVKPHQSWYGVSRTNRYNVDEIVSAIERKFVGVYDFRNLKQAVDSMANKMGIPGANSGLHLNATSPSETNQINRYRLAESFKNEYALLRKIGIEFELKHASC